MFRVKFYPFLPIISISLVCYMSVYAKPSGFHLKSGQAHDLILENGAWVMKSGKKAMIDWESFSIDQHEIVRFQQMDTQSYVLNRVTGKNESALLGQLFSNGSIYLINPNGVFIGPNAHIETAGFIASTLDLINQDLSGKVMRFAGSSEKSIVNQGTIYCPAGDIFFIGRTVENSGTLNTPNGRQGLLSSCDVLIHPEQAPQILIRSDTDMDAQEFAENPYALAIRHSGNSTGSEVYLIAEKGLCEVNGSITAQNGDHGGDVHVLGTDVHLLDGTDIDASGLNGGGVVLIGGDYQGKNPSIQNAKHVWVGENTHVRADGWGKADGGKVIFWSDEATFHYGTISIRGGAEGGNGGLAEVSGKRLEYRGFTDGTAPWGQMGQLLLDPNDVVIGALTTTGTFSTCSFPSTPATYTFSTDVTNEILNTDLQTQLSTCNVIINTVGTSGSGPNSGSITVSSPVSWSAGTTLTLTANSFITISAAVTNTNTGSTFNAMNFTANGTSAGSNAGITLNSGGVLTTNTGTIILNGTSSGSHGVFFNNGSLTSTSGAISITGLVPLGSSSAASGIFMATTNGITSTSGPITLSGTTNTNGNGGNGCSIALSWTPGTSGLVTFSNCNGSPSSETSSGVNFSLMGPFSGSGNVLFTNCSGGDNLTSGGHGINVANGSSLTTTGNITATTSITGNGAGGIGFNSHGAVSTSGTNATISITATSTGISGANHGIALTGGTLQTTGGGAITLNGTGAPSSINSDGISMSGTALISTLTGSGPISLTGAASGFAQNIGINIAGTTSPITSTSGSISLSGTSTASGGSAASSHGVAIGSTWTTDTTGTVTFSNCSGGTGTTSHGVAIGSAFTGSGDVTFTNCTGGNDFLSGGDGVKITNTFSTTGNITGTNIAGNGGGSVGFTTNSNFSTSGTNKTINITAKSNGIVDTCHGIALTGGTLSTTGGGSITLNGTAGQSGQVSNGINISGTGLVSTVTGNGPISLTGSAPGASGGVACVGINLAGTSNSITSTSGSITLSGSSTAPGTSSHGVSVASSWTPGTSAAVTFSNCSGSSGGQSSHGVSIGNTVTGSGNVLFTNCTGGNNGTAGGNGITISSPLTTTGNITATTSITGRGNGGVGFASSANVSTSGTAISITAIATGTSGAAHGISITGGTLSTTGGGSITLNGMGGTSSTASNGINISGTGLISTATGNGSISLTGSASGTAAGVGINVAGTTNSIVSTSGLITLNGTSTATVANADGISINSSSWSPNTSSTVSLTGTGGAIGASYGINIATALANTGQINLSGTHGVGTGSFGNAIGANITTAGGILNVSGTTVLTNSVTLDTTNGGLTAAGANIVFSGTGATIDALASGAQGLTLTAGTSGMITFGGAIGSINPLASLSATAASITQSSTAIITGPLHYTAAAIDIDGGITTSAGTISMTGPVVLANTPTFNTTSGASGGAAISFSSTVDGTAALTLNAGTSGTILFSGAIGSITPLTSLSATAATITQSSTAITTGALSYTGSTAINIDGNITTSAGIISMAGPVVIANAPTFNTTSGAAGGATISFANTLDGATNLTLNAGTSGNISFLGIVGGMTPLTNLSFVNANTIQVGNNITVSNPMPLTHPLTFSLPVSVTGTSTITSTNANITFSSTLDGANALTLNAGTGAILFSGAIGSITPLASLSATAATITQSSTAITTGPLHYTAAAIDIDGGITTSAGTISMTGAVVLANTPTFNTTSGAAGGATISFSSTVDGTAALTLNAGTSGSVLFSGAIGSITPLTSLSATAATITQSSTAITTGGLSYTGSTAVNIDGTITTSGGAIALAGPVVIANAPTFNTTSGAPAGAGISFANTLDGATDLTLNAGTSGNIALSGAVGSITPLSALIFSNAANITSSNSISANSITQTAGSGTTTFSHTLTIGSNISLTGTNFTFNAVTGTANNLTITNSGILSMPMPGDLILSGAFLQSGSGVAQVQGNITSSNQGITFDKAVTLVGDASLDAHTGISFSSTVDGGYNLVLNGDSINFGSIVGGSPLKSIQATATTTITTAGNQTVNSGPMQYNGNVILTTDTQFFDNGTSGIVFQSSSGNSITGNFNLTLLAPNTNALVQSDIVLSGSSGLSGGSFIAFGETGLTFNGQILTQGGSATGTGGDGGSISLISNSGSISVHNINSSGGSGTTAQGDAGNILLQPASGYSNQFPIGIIIVNNDLSSGLDGNFVANGASGTAGIITLSAQRASSATVATITSSVAGNDISISGLTFIMGPYEAMTCLGNLTISCPTVTLGDLVALDTLSILSSTVNLLIHGDESIFNNLGHLYISPSLHFLGGTGYVQTGVLNPSGPLNAKDLGFSPTTFRPLLLLNPILNYDTSPQPVPPQPPIQNSKEYALYEKLIADAQLSDLLSVYPYVFFDEFELPYTFLPKPYEIRKK